jgi:co-chaperonin GroES (HSP10)
MRHDNLLLQRETRPRMTLSGIEIPDAAAEKPTLGLVISIGEEVSDCISVGDTVAFDKFEFLDYQDDLIIVKDKHIIVVFKK